MRRNLRPLMKLIEMQKRKPNYNNFEDQIGEDTPVELGRFATRDSFERFKAKAQHFLREYVGDLAIHKLRMNEALAQTDLIDLNERSRKRLGAA